MGPVVFRSGVGSVFLPQRICFARTILEQANLIYISNLVDMGGKKALKSRSKIYIADTALRNAILVFDEAVLSDPNEMGVIIETAVYKHVASFYYPVLPRVGYWAARRTGK
ncbi:MAG TPA: DUF4143 domain-containing protein [Spirochaetia bacterium]|nr:DUF4143 domain-containing protein [Spirochaetia bacterium]